MIDFAPSAPLDHQPLTLLWAWHGRAYQEAVSAFKAGDFPLMHRAYKRLGEIQAEIDLRESPDTEWGRGERSERQPPTAGGING